MKKEKAFSIDKRFWPGAALLTILAALSFVFIKNTAALGAILFFWTAHIVFFRDPRRTPAGEGVLAPADGKVVEVSFCDEPRFICGKAVKIGIFLSLFDVHVNRMPWRGTLQWQEHVPGRFLNALHPDAALKNESNWLGFCDGETKFVVRQISGLVARHIHWDIEKGAVLERGDKIGIICYGSRTELYLPAEKFMTSVRVGDAVKSARTVLGGWKS
jgi:phosphatidylserine decarboxylase